MSIRSSSIFHFTKSIDYLKGILKEGLWPRYCVEHVEWFGGLGNGVNYIAYPMVCFCDLPISKINDHVEFYGYFGIGFTKEWAIKSGLNPVMYWANSDWLSNALTFIATSLSEREDRDSEISINGRMGLTYFLGYSKPIKGNMHVGEEVIEKDFYLESEWRLIPQHTDIDRVLTYEEACSKERVDAANAATREYSMLGFQLSDIRYIFVKEDTDIPDIINFIQTELDEFKSSDLKVLMSRVTSLETLKRDL